jgi:hypothetical protein
MNHRTTCPRWGADILLRLSFGLSLLIVGVVHYMHLADFVTFVSDATSPLTYIAQGWAYILPGLMIVGGFLLAFNVYPQVGAWAAGLALCSIPVGMLLKSVIGGKDLGEMMNYAINTFIWILVYMTVVRCSCTTKSGARKK